MVGEWQPTTWGALATLEYGKALRGYGNTGQAVVFGTNGPIGRHTDALWQGPGVIVGRKGAYRGVHYTEEPYWVIDTAYSLQPRQPINLRWAYYQLKSVDINNIDDGSPIPSTTRPAFYAVPVQLPPRREQDAIAHILSALDDKIELNRRMAVTLEAMARALFKSWFVDFDPVHAKAERRPTGLPDEIAAVFPSSFDDEGLPEGWRASSLSELATLNPESWSASNRPAFLDYVDLSNTKWGRIDAVQRFPAAEAPSRAQRLLRIGDSIVGTVRPGNGSYAFVGRGGLTGSTGFAVLRPSNTQNAAFVYLAVTQPSNITTLALLADGGAYPAVRPEAVAETPVNLGSSAIMSAFDNIASNALSRIEAAANEASTLAALRDTLLPRLISGELRIRDTESAIEAA